MNITVASGVTSASPAKAPNLGAPPKPPAVAAAVQRHDKLPVPSTQSTPVQPLTSGLGSMSRKQGFSTVA